MATEVRIACGLSDHRSRLTMSDVCSAQLVLLFIEELLDSQSLAQCRTVFSFLESRREAIIAVSAFTISESVAHGLPDKLPKQIFGHSATMQRAAPSIVSRRRPGILWASIHLHVPELPARRQELSQSSWKFPRRERYYIRRRSVRNTCK